MWLQLLSVLALGTVAAAQESLDKICTYTGRSCKGRGIQLELLEGVADADACADRCLTLKDPICQAAMYFVDLSECALMDAACDLKTSTQERTAILLIRKDSSTECDLAPVDGDWGAWSAFGTCTVTCGGGTRQRTRTCDNPLPSNGGKECDGLAMHSTTCNPLDCADPDECNDNPCDTNAVCTNQPGIPIDLTESCDCLPTWVGDGLTCEKAPLSFMAALKYKQEWDDEFLDLDSPVVKTFAKDMKGKLTKSMQSKFGENFIGLTITSFSEGSIIANVDVSFSDAEEVDTDSVAGAVEEGMVERDGKCFIGTNEVACEVEVSDFDECAAGLTIHQCHESTNCLNEPVGSYSCICKAEFPKVGETVEANVIREKCRVNGNWGTWSSFDACTATCGTGTQQRNRTCDNPSPLNGGAACADEPIDVQNCNENPCPVDGGFGEWSEYDTCTVTCGGGSQTRNRTCDSPRPAHGGGECVGDWWETQSCNQQACPVNGNWGDWSAYDTCTVTCGGGTHERIRTCDSPVPAHGGINCAGEGTASQNCNESPCPIDGAFGDWSAWTTCSATCGTGTKDRSRTCDSPAPAHGGNGCSGDASESTNCNTDVCPVDGNWGDWAAYEECSVTCGGGTQQRTRACDNPAPIEGGASCAGVAIESQNCNANACPVDGGLGDWSTWGACSVTCGIGTEDRTRACDNPAPAHGGAECGGDTSENQNCDAGPCPGKCNGGGTNVQGYCWDDVLM